MPSGPVTSPRLFDLRKQRISSIKKHAINDSRQPIIFSTKIPSTSSHLVPFELQTSRSSSVAVPGLGSVRTRESGIFPKSIKRSDKFAATPALEFIKIRRIGNDDVNLRTAICMIVKCMPASYLRGQITSARLLSPEYSAGCDSSFCWDHGSSKNLGLLSLDSYC